MTSLLVANTITARRLDVPAPRCSTTRCRSRARSAMRSTTTGSRWSRWRPAGSRTSIGRSTTTSSTRPTPSAAAERAGRSGRRRSTRARVAHVEPSEAQSLAAAQLAARLFLQRLPGAPARRDPDAALRRRSHAAASAAPSSACRRRTARSPSPRGWRVRSLGARRRRSPTMGQERLIARGIVWRRFVEVQGILRRRRRESHGQALPTPPPPSTERPARRRAQAGASDHAQDRTAPSARRPHLRAAREHARADDRPDHFFGAYIGKFNLARRLAEQGLRVRIVAVDPTRLPDTWREQLRVTRASTPFSTRWRSSSPRPRAAALEVNPTRLVHRHDLVDRAPGPPGDAGARPRALRLRHPGVRPADVSRSDAGRRDAPGIHVPPLRGLLDRASPGLLPDPPSRRLRGRGRGRATGIRSRFATRSRPSIHLGRTSCAAGRRASSFTRGPRRMPSATCSSSA